MKRCFVGLALPSATHLALRPLLADLASLRDPYAQVRPVPETNLHCTLKFLGPVTDDQIASLQGALAAAAARFLPFIAQTAGIGAFGAPRPRSIYARVGPGHEHLLVLGNLIDGCCQKLGFARDPTGRVPHVTLARVQNAQSDNVLMPWVERQPAKVLYGPLETSLLHLYQSEMSPQGSIYTPLYAMPIGADAAR